MSPRPKSSGDLYWQNKYLNYWIYYKSKTHFTHGYTSCNTLNLTHRISNALPQVHTAHSLSPLKDWDSRTGGLREQNAHPPTIRLPSANPLQHALFIHTPSPFPRTHWCEIIQASKLYFYTSGQINHFSHLKKSSKMSFATLKATENIGYVPRWGKKCTNAHASATDRIGFPSLSCTAECTLVLRVSSPPPSQGTHVQRSELGLHPWHQVLSLRSELRTISSSSSFLVGTRNAALIPTYSPPTGTQNNHKHAQLWFPKLLFHFTKAN